MPLLTLKTNISLDNKAQLAAAASAYTAELLGKPQSYVMVLIEDGQCMSFAGNDQPCALLELKSLGLPESSTAEFCAGLCEFIKAHTDIEANRVYIEFASPERHMWGWDRRTF